jgi:hypothetical protein
LPPSVPERIQGRGPRKFRDISELVEIAVVVLDQPGPFGRAYVGQLTGFPFPPGTANVFRVRRHRAPTVKAGGFTTVVDIARGPHGSLYVLQIASDSLVAGPTPGKLLRVDRDGTNRASRWAAVGADGPRGVPPRHHLRRQQRRLADRRADRAHPRRLTRRSPLRCAPADPVLSEQHRPGAGRRTARDPRRHRHSLPTSTLESPRLGVAGLSACTSSRSRGSNGRN